MGLQQFYPGEVMPESVQVNHSEAGIMLDFRYFPSQKNKVISGDVRVRIEDVVAVFLRHIREHHYGFLRHWNRPGV